MIFKSCAARKREERYRKDGWGRIVGLSEECFLHSQPILYPYSRSLSLKTAWLQTSGDENEGEVSSCCDGLCRPSAGRSSSSHQPVPVAVVASVEAKNTSLLYARRRQKHFSTTRPYVKNTSLLYAPTSKTLLYYSTFYLHRLSFYLNTITHFFSFAWCF